MSYSSPGRRRRGLSYSARGLFYNDEDDDEEEEDKETLAIERSPKTWSILMLFLTSCRINWYLYSEKKKIESTDRQERQAPFYPYVRAEAAGAQPTFAIFRADQSVFNNLPVGLNPSGRFLFQFTVSTTTKTSTTTATSTLTATCSSTTSYATCSSG